MYPRQKISPGLENTVKVVQFFAIHNQSKIDLLHNIQVISFETVDYKRRKLPR